MMTRFTKELRQEVVKDYCLRHGGHYDAPGFFAEVQAQGESHPAYGWFQWDRDEAALQHNLWQARAFAQGLKIKFEIEVVQHDNVVVKIQQSMPLVLSPAGERRSGGGYDIGNPDDHDQVAELCHQAATALQSWLNRYGSCVYRIDSPVSTAEFEAVIALLRAVEATAAA